MTSTHVHVVIPTYNHWNLTHSLLWDLHSKEKNNIDSILIVNNGSTDEEVSGGLKWWTRETTFNKYPIQVLDIEENCGFLLAANRGLEQVVHRVDPYVDANDVVILLSNDVQIKAPFISQIRDILSVSAQTLIGGILYSSSTGWNMVGGKIYPYLEGWLLATTASNWEMLNYFDERFAPHIYEDIDLSTTALKMGYELVPLNNVGLVHMAGQTILYTPERDKLTLKNKEKFEAKWS